ncbi:hypothetical protein H7S74_30285 [Priestia aryabhattai]|uniref:hypothetical protein n=1 Tax=Priestia aryabhattai TaxID=412384 RepID=UPI001EC2D5CD|nr:hypothetical protein [Priestia aryabhattai]MBY0094928.1 hypothetical protein [Priestia aryabhattai]MBY0105584.1 hypothetical protein [Priestia aryabhattai]
MDIILTKVSNVYRTLYADDKPFNEFLSYIEIEYDAHVNSQVLKGTLSIYEHSKPLEELTTFDIKKFIIGKLCEQ